MPLGWYLAQGLIPLAPSDSDDEEGPCTLPNGRVVCGPHGLVVCGKCCMDFSFMDDVLDEDEGSDYDYDEFDVSKPDNREFFYDAFRSAVDDAAYDNSDSSDSVAPLELHSYAAEVVDTVPATTLAVNLPRPDPPLIRGTGKVMGTKFTTPSGKVEIPLNLFTGRTRGHFKRYTLPVDSGKFVIHTDGACANNGQANPQAGWAYWHGDSATDGRTEPLIASGRLEKKGPFGDDAPQTSNRAELRAVIAALRHQSLPWPGMHTVVIATDSSHVVLGATDWAKKWVKNKWKRREPNGRWLPVKNRDLWQALLGEVERYKDAGMKVEFWLIPREWNAVADKAAKDAAALVDAPERWTD